MFTPRSHLVAFSGSRRIAAGTPLQVALQAQALLAAQPQSQLLVFNTETGKQVELDLRGTAAELQQRMSPESAETKGDGEARLGKGRPRLGVTAREVTLLPRHWEWLSLQPGGVSQALRRLVETAIAKPDAEQRRRSRSTAAYNFMHAVAGNEKDFDEVARALFAGNDGQLQTLLADWPADVRDQLLAMLADPAPDGSR